MDSTSRLERRLQERRYANALRTASQDLDGLGIEPAARTAVSLDEAQMLWPAFLTRLRAKAASAVHQPVGDADALQRRLDRLAERVGPMPLIWFAVVDAEPAAFEVPADVMLRAAIFSLVSRERDLMLGTRDATGGLCVELNHTLKGDEYELASWGGLAL